MSWPEILRSLDASIFQWINSGWSNPVFDALMPWCREKWIWAPLYLFIATFSWINFGNRGWVLVIGLTMAAGLADFTSSSLIKKNVQRLRPCNDPELRATVVLRLDNCGSGYSFTSSHAANHFAAAVFLIGFLGRWSRWAKPVLLGWAGLIALSQVYVGVHFPGDIFFGGILGALIGWALARLLQWTGLVPQSLK